MRPKSSSLAFNDTRSHATVCVDCSFACKTMGRFKSLQQVFSWKCFSWSLSPLGWLESGGFGYGNQFLQQRTAGPVNHTNGITCMRGFGLPVLLLPQSLDRAAQLTTSAHAPARPGNAGTLPVATELQIPRPLENAGGSSHRPTAAGDNWRQGKSQRPGKCRAEPTRAAPN